MSANSDPSHSPTDESIMMYFDIVEPRVRYTVKLYFANDKYCHKKKYFNLLTIVIYEFILLVNKCVIPSFFACRWEGVNDEYRNVLRSCVFNHFIVYLV